jgi:hypothetical protein
VTDSPALFPARGRHPRSAETSLVDALKVARQSGHVLPADLAAVGLARQAARAVDDALRAEERADNVATLIRAHLSVLTALGLTPAARLERNAADVADLGELLAGLDQPS